MRLLYGGLVVFISCLLEDEDGLMSTIPPVILVVIAIVVAHRFADIYGVAIAGIGMLSTLGIQDATDAYGPVADNAAMVRP